MIKQLAKYFFTPKEETIALAVPPSVPSAYARAYAQCGEDMMCAFVLGVLMIESPVYLDIGCFDARKFSNTFHFYEKGAQGVCVDANPLLARKFAAERPRDKVLNIGLSGKSSGNMPFYVMQHETLSTFSQQEALRLESEGASAVRETVGVDVHRIDDFLRDHFADRRLDLVSLDVEGFDQEIIEAFDFDYVRPAVFCVETLEYKERGVQRKNQAIIDTMNARGYMHYGDTFINSVFVDRQRWDTR